MKYLLLTFISIIVLSGCTNRVSPSIAQQEPDTEWIMEQYKGQSEFVVNQRRIKEGW